MLTKDLAICIRAVDYSETSQIVTFFTKANGKVGVIAKGSKRPRSAFGGPIEIFSYGQIVFTDSNREKLATLTEFEPAAGTAGFMNLHRELFTLNCCLFAVELAGSLTDDYDPHPSLFDALFHFLHGADEIRDALGASRDVLALLILFQLDLLKQIGLQPILSACVNCRRTFETDWQECYFSSSANGLICRDCETSFADKLSLSKQAAACLSDLETPADCDRQTLNELEKILISHFTSLLHRPPKMAKHILAG